MTLRTGVCSSKFLFFILITQVLLACRDDNKPVQTNTSQRKISSNLSNVIEDLESDSSAEQNKGLARIKTARMDKQGRIQIYIILYQVDDIILDELKSNGVKIDIYDGNEKVVQGWATPEKIKMITEFPYVKSVELPTHGVSN